MSIDVRITSYRLRRDLDASFEDFLVKSIFTVDPVRSG